MTADSTRSGRRPGVASPGSERNARATAPRAAGGPRTRRLRGSGRIELVVDFWGEPSGHPVLLLHGGGQTRAAWSATAAILAEAGWQAIAPDLRGHGDSDWPQDGAYEPEHFAADLRSLLEQIGRSTAVVGASLGGIVALTAQRLAGEQLFAALVLVDVTPRLEREGVERIVGFMLAHPEGFSSLPEAADAIAAFRPTRPRPADLSGLERTLFRGSDGRWRWRWDPRFLSTKFRRGDGGVALEYRHAEMRERLIAGARKVSAPVLLVRGALSDVVSRDGVEEFVRAVPHAEFVDVEHAGHMVAGHRNDVFSAAVLDFLTRVVPPG